MTIPGHIKVPCNCFGTLGQFELEQSFHEMGVPGCKNSGAVPSPHDPVVLPHHYTRFKIEPVHFIMVNELPFWAGNIIKYTCRYDAKDGLQDLKKAKRYLEMQIKRMEGDEEGFSK